MEEREVTTHESQHILSQAYKVMVDVPDPPREELAEDEGKKVNSRWTKTDTICKMHFVGALFNMRGTSDYPLLLLFNSQFWPTKHFSEALHKRRLWASRSSFAS